MKTLVVVVALTLFVAQSAFSSAEAVAAVPMSKAPDTLTFEFRDTPFASAVDALFKGSGKSYVIDSEVDKRKTIPSLLLRDLAFDQALKAVVKAGGCTYRIDGGNIYIITPKVQNVSYDIPQTPPIPEPEPAVIDRKVDKLVLQYIDVQDLASLFGAGGFISRSSTMVAGNGGQMNGLAGVGMQNGGFNNMPMSSGAGMNPGMSMMSGNGYRPQSYPQGQNWPQQGYQPQVPMVAVGR